MNTVGNTLAHPDVHAPWSQWSEDQRLHVACAYSNPFRWRTRRELLNDFRRHMRQSPNAVLHVGELAYGARPFEVTGDDPLDIQLRTTHELFHKENILNAVIAKGFPADWQYGSIIDGDFHMTRHDWALEAIHLLQHFDFVQLFSSYSDMTAKGYGGMRPMRNTASFAHNYFSSGCQLPAGYSAGGWKTQTPYSGIEKGPTGAKYVGATGGAWAFRRSAFNAVGRLLDTCILGHGDWFMAFGLVSQPAPDMRIARYTEGYQRSIAKWQTDAAALTQNVGCLDNHAIHYWHGSKVKRGYSSRDQILVEHGFDPTADLKQDFQGIWQLSAAKPRLRDAIRQYFISRSEDDPNLYGTEKAIV